jgi:predicted NUDIX family NTP pyrophosphohydrolase
MKRSAGILLYRLNENHRVEFFLVHPGGPFFAKKDDGYWTIPKGEIDEGEDALVAAKREFEEETGKKLDGPFIHLGEIKQKAGKVVEAWAINGDIDPTRIVSNHFEIEWPPRTGKIKSFPEVDRAGWFDQEQASKKILPAQSTFLQRVIASFESNI